VIKLIRDRETTVYLQELACAVGIRRTLPRCACSATGAAEPWSIICCSLRGPFAL